MFFRYLEKNIVTDLGRRMVFVGGPRQVGKTTLVKKIGKEYFKDFDYFNWDNKQHRKKILSRQYNPSAKLLIFDEIHKYGEWKNYLKGEYDVLKQKYRFIATGSARMDIYQKGGDSMMGRYRYYRLHPLSLAELRVGDSKEIEPFKELFFPKGDKAVKINFEQLFKFGGFPEPFALKNEDDLRRFHNEKSNLLIKEDIRDLENISDLSKLQVLTEILPEKVGSKLSINSLREDLSVSYNTLSKWMDILERFYYHFRIYPNTSSKIRSLKKEPKMYLWDWSELEDEEIRLENMVASGLLKLVHYLYDRHGFKAELRFVQDRDGREVDFLVVIDQKPWFAVEVKASIKHSKNNIKYFAKRLEIPFSYLVVMDNDVDYLSEGIRYMDVKKFLAGLI